jgi:DNA-binding beta-propeller fold protein YncE
MRTTASKVIDGMDVSLCRRRFTRFCVLASLALLSGIAGPARAADSVSLRVETKIPLGEVHGRIDHLAVDIKRHRLYVAELGNNSVGVVDVQAGKTVRTLAGLKEPQGIGYDPSTDTLYVANDSDGSVRLFNGEDLSSLGRIELGDDADNVRIEEAAHRVWVGYGSGALAVIDANSRRKVLDIPLKAHPESFRLTPTSSLIYVNVPNNGEIAVVDRSSNRPIASWKTGDLRSNYPLALDDAGQVLAVFRHPARLAVFRPQDGKRLQALQTCGDSDDVFVDAKRQRVYVTCGEGAIDVFSHSANGYQHTGRLETSSGARTSLFVPELDRLYLAVRAGFSTPASIWVVRPEP